MPALEFDEHHPLFDPDQLKMPESPAHRQSIDVIALTATRLLGPTHRVFRDMNWYPPDGGNAMAPDLFVLPIDAMPLPAEDPTSWPKSYRQDKTNGPVPSVSVEVPSETDSFAALRTKAARCRRLGVTVYLVVIDSTPPDILRLAADSQAEEVWTGRPIPELGGLSIEFDGGLLTVTTPDGLRVTSDDELADQLEARARSQAEAAETRAEAAEDRAEAAETRAERLAEQLRAFGVDPDGGGT